jgi:hypothetical protein
LTFTGTFFALTTCLPDLGDLSPGEKKTQVSNLKSSDQPKVKKADPKQNF